MYQLHMIFTTLDMYVWRNCYLQKNVEHLNSRRRAYSHPKTPAITIEK